MLFANHKINRLLTFRATGTLSKKNWNCAPSPPRAPFPQIPAPIVPPAPPRAPFPKIPALIVPPFPPRAPFPKIPAPNVPPAPPRAPFPQISSLFVHERM